MPRQESEELERALDKGSGGELPPNVPPGLLGERGLNIQKTDPDSHGMNAGLTQELDGPVMWLVVVLAYLVFFPAAYWILWRSRVIPRRSKIAGTVLMTVGLVALALWWLLAQRGL